MNSTNRGLPKVFIITGVNNNWAYTDKFLKCTEAQNYKNIEVVVVDDGSSDGTAQKIAEYYPRTKVEMGDGTLWWTGCMHVGLERVLLTANNGDYILTINNDCIFKKDFVTNLIAASKDNPGVVIGSIALSLDDNNSIVDSGAKIDWTRGQIGRAGYGRLTEVPKNYIYNCKIDALTTRGTLFPVSVVKEVGNFDIKHLPHYISDLEYTIRIKKNGFGLVVAYNCIIYNDVRRTGFSGPTNKPINKSEFMDMLFGRKSQINIIDHYHFINLCCPWYLKPINYLFLIGKFLYLASFLPPLYPIRKPIVNLRNYILSTHTEDE